MSARPKNIALRVPFSGTNMSSTSDINTLTLSENCRRARPTLMGIVVINGTGNALNNGLTDNAVANLLSGLAGHDSLTGLNGSNGNYILHAGGYSKQMQRRSIQLHHMCCRFVAGELSWLG